MDIWYYDIVLNIIGVICYDCKERMDCMDRTDCKDGMDYKDKTD